MKFGVHGSLFLFVMFLGFHPFNSTFLNSFLEPAFAQSSNWIERSIEVTTEEKNANVARKLLLEKATEQVSEDIIKEIIGVSKFERNRTLIQSKVIKLSPRYVPFAKPSELIPIITANPSSASKIPSGTSPTVIGNGVLPAEQDGYKMTVLLRIYQDDLQKLLLENGLFYESDSTPIVLPIIKMTDKVTGRNWNWMDSADPKKSDLIHYSKTIETSLRNSFWKNNFYLIRPQANRYSEFLDFSKTWNAQILIDGELIISKSLQKSEAFVITISFLATQVQNSREIADVRRKFETEPGPAEIVIGKKLKDVLELTTHDLATQVLEAWQKGSLGSNLYKLVIKGSVPLLFQEKVKETMKGRAIELKNIRERLISSNEIVYEIDSSLTPKEYATKYPRWLIDAYNLQVESSNEKEIQYKVTKEEKAL